MSYYCKLCDKTMKTSSKEKHKKSDIHITLERQNIYRCFIINPDFDRVNEIVRNYVNLQIKNSDRFIVHCLFKMLTNTKTIKYIRLPPGPHLIF